MASAVFIIPGIFLYVYLGSLADDIRELSSGDSPLNGTTTIIIAAVSGQKILCNSHLELELAIGVVIILTVVLTSRYAKRAINKRLMMDMPDAQPPPIQERIPSQDHMLASNV